MEVKAYIEILKGSRDKLEYDRNSCPPALSCNRKIKYKYPFAYGFIPGTLAGDGDELDCIILDPKDMIAGVIYTVYPAVIVFTKDEAGQDNKIICSRKRSKGGIPCGLCSCRQFRKTMRFLRKYKGQNGIEIQGYSWVQDRIHKEINECVARKMAHNAVYHDGRS